MCSTLTPYELEHTLIDSLYQIDMNLVTNLNFVGTWYKLFNQLCCERKKQQIMTHSHRSKIRDIASNGIEICCQIPYADFILKKVYFLDQFSALMKEWPY